MKTIDILSYDTPKSFRAFTTTRHGGVSVGKYESMNINRYCGDCEENIQENMRILCDAVSTVPNKIITARQTHGTNIICIDGEFLSLTASEQIDATDGVDALITNVVDVYVGVSTADCVPILLCDPINGVVGAVHAGWRGTAQRITEKVITKMAETYSTDLNEILAYIGPAISVEAFEVGEEVYYEFAAANFDMDKISVLYGKKWHIDLPLANMLMMHEMGLPTSNIYMSGECTYTQHERYFSARRLGVASGRLLSAIAVVSETSD